jgi:hypothetical protein
MFEGNASAWQSMLAELWLLLLPLAPLVLVEPPVALVLVELLLPAFELELGELLVVPPELVVKVALEPALPLLLVPLVRDEDEAAGSAAQLTAHKPLTIDQNTAPLLRIASPLHAAQREPNPRPDLLNVATQW